MPRKTKIMRCFALGFSRDRKSVKNEEGNLLTTLLFKIDVNLFDLP